MRRAGMARSWKSWVLVAAALVLLVACHTITEETPTEPTEVATEPTLAAIRIPVILPASNPAPAPTPVGPSPTPTPEPSPPPSGGCNVPPSNPSSLSCTDDPPHFLDQVEDAITRVTENKPELFDFESKKCINCYFVRDVDAYIAAVIQELSRVDLCGHWDGEEVAVKESNNFSEQYDIILSSNHIRRGQGAYRGVCRPAWF
jgi:hypothetical protein